jgi:hypothetical protein
MRFGVSCCSSPPSQSLRPGQPNARRDLSPSHPVVAALCEPLEIEAAARPRRGSTLLQLYV